MKTSRRMDIERNRKIISLLNEERYVLGRKIGEGYNREAYEVLYKKDRLSKRRIAKIYKPEAYTDSIQHKINLAKDLNEKEIDVLNDIMHPNIVQVMDILARDDIYITIEDYFDAISLEDRISIYGPMQNHELFRHVFSQVSNAMKYLNIEKNLLHRDIKPQNILLGRRDDLVKLSDFQNAVKISDIASKLLPTRGATQFTHPRLLNSLIKGREDHSNLATEFYSLGITMYRVLMGELPFDFKVKMDDNGRKIRINEEILGISLNDGDCPISEIGIDAYEQRLNDKISKIPERYRNLLWNCLSMKSSYYDSEDPKIVHKLFEESFNHATAERGKAYLDFGKLKPLASKLQIDAEQVQAIIQDFAMKVVQFGKRTLSSNFDSTGYGSDAVSTSNNIEIYLLKQGTLLQGNIELIVEDKNLNYTGGTYTAIWSEIDDREFKIIHNGKQVLGARRTLSYKSGDVIEPRKDYQTKFPWEIKLMEGLENIIDKTISNEGLSVDALSLINCLQENKLSSSLFYPYEPETNERIFDKSGVPSFKVVIDTIVQEKPIRFQRFTLSKEILFKALELLSTKEFEHLAKAKEIISTLKNDGVYTARECARKLGEDTDWEDAEFEKFHY